MAEHKLSWGDLGVGKSVVSRLLDPSDDGAGFQIGTLRRAAAQLQCNWQDLAEP